MSECLCVYVYGYACVKEEGEEGVDDANVSAMEVHTGVCLSVYLSVSMCIGHCMCEGGGRRGRR